MIRLIFIGDLIPGTYSSQEISLEVREAIQGSNYSFANLESPLTNEDTPISKIGNNFKVDPKNVEILKLLKINYVCLANNHILDQGDIGLRETITTLKDNGIHYLGAGENLQEAQKPIIIQLKDKKIAFINVCESEFSIAKNNKPGANSFVLIELFKQIQALKEKVNYIFVIYHGGVEYYPLPSPELREKLRFIIDIGADAVICHHTHVFGAYEYYNDKPIFYSLGNFFAPTKRKMPDDFYESAVLKMIINNEKITHELIPIKQETNPICIRKMEGKEKKIFMQRTEKINEILQDEKEFMKNWFALINDRKQYYSHIISRFNNRYIKKLRNLNLLPLPSYRSKKSLQLLNVLRCESHRECLTSIIEKESSNE